mmetsp:Transcript_22518/g.50412  ORF Transcript_22518/g.50412 Transcript_22518/m.50412 type:complete len:214 (+) Transcript_22518:175-816(+)
MAELRSINCFFFFLFFFPPSQEKMKTIKNSETISVPAGVTVEVKHRRVRVRGPRGELKRDFGHVRADIFKPNPSSVTVAINFAQGKQGSSIRSVCSHIENMITGVTKGFLYKMRFVYAHFPINFNVVQDGQACEIRNFLGEKVTRRVQFRSGVTVVRSDDVKDEIQLSGNSIEDVSNSAALIHGACLVKRKDIRKFLDGIYLSEKTTIVKDDL